VTSVNAQLLGDTIYCDTMEFSYTSRAPNITATFAVIWGGSKPLDNPDNVHGTFQICAKCLFEYEIGNLHEFSQK
jgi:plexin A